MNSLITEVIFSQPAIYVCVGSIVVGDQFFLQEPDLFKSIGFGAAVAAGSLVGLYFAEQQIIKNVVSKPNFKNPLAQFNESIMTLRVGAIGGGVVSGYLVNTLVLNKPFQFSEVPLIAGSLLMAEFVQRQYMMGKMIV